MRQLPRGMVNRLQKLDLNLIKEITKNYLSGKEMQAVLAREELMLLEIDRIIKQFGRDNVIY